MLLLYPLHWISSLTLAGITTPGKTPHQRFVAYRFIDRDSRITRQGPQFNPCFRKSHLFHHSESMPEPMNLRTISIAGDDKAGNLLYLAGCATNRANINSANGKSNSSGSGL